jgi:hypothetical protein
MTKEERRIKAEMEAAAEAKNSNEDTDENEDTEGDESDEDEAADETEGDDASSEKGKKKKDDPSQIDYEAEAKREKDRADAAERALAEDRYQFSKKKRSEKESDEGEDAGEGEEEKPLTSRQLSQMLDERDRRNEKRMQESVALNIARQNTGSESEAQAALTFWRTRVIPTGNLEEDIQFAIGGLNGRRLAAKNQELNRSLRGKRTMSDDAAGSHRDAAPGTAPKLAPSYVASLHQQGYTWDSTLRKYKKEIANGKKLLLLDPKTKKLQSIKK